MAVAKQRTEWVMSEPSEEALSQARDMLDAATTTEEQLRGLAKQLDEQWRNINGG